MALRKQILLQNLHPLPPKSTAIGKKMKKLSQRKDYTPRSWKKYFEKADDISLENGNIFRVYRLGSSGPLVLLLHGGGYSGLTWSLFAESILTMVDCQIAALDLRGHGCTTCSNEDDLSAETLSKDVGEVMSAMFPDGDLPPTVIIGHSMGGAVAVHIAYQQYIPSLIGLAVIDVVEGTAMAALHSMQSFLRGRPSVFKSIEHAIEWCVRSGQVRNVQSARVSMPSQIKNTYTNVLSAEEIQDHPIETTSQNSFDGNAKLTSSDSIPEEDENVTSPVDNFEVSDEFKAPEATKNSESYTWRIDLSKSEKYWSGWFSGLSKMFLSCQFPTLLLLAGIDSLDTELTVGQMQGKFQMQILPQCGHAVHEDVPDRVAEVIASFLVRHKFATAKSHFQVILPAC